MKISIDEDSGTNSIYIDLKDELIKGESVRQRVIEEKLKNKSMGRNSVIVDFNKEGEIIAVEISR